MSDNRDREATGRDAGSMRAATGGDEEELTPAGAEIVGALAEFYEALKDGDGLSGALGRFRSSAAGDEEGKTDE